MPPVPLCAKVLVPKPLPASQSQLKARLTLLKAEVLPRKEEHRKQRGRKHCCWRLDAGLRQRRKPPAAWVCSAGVLRSPPGSSKIQVSEISTSFIAGDSGLPWGFGRKKARSRSPCEKWSFVN